MTSDDFKAWLADMKEAGLATSDAHCGRLLGRSANQIVNMKNKGADKATGLACSALLAGLDEYQKK
ncbi:hypothetical protein B0E33_01370 [Roseibium algicola]|uniref:Uncharacterized protein n=1 Tax=Roseibium algicola TaxID=2857014 RepID=A0ABN4WNT1_9HYPH|nr:hypothetical protein [Roseibium aggregatum]AQQ02405.1 hypothetical protein B0E33_01370 [Roseibium aggregatum]